MSLPEKEIVLASISLFMLLNGNNLNVLNITEQFLYTMIAFLGKDHAFLEPNVKGMLENFVDSTFISQDALNFESKLSGKNSIFSAYQNSP